MMSEAKKPLLIAEVKTHSPYGWRSDESWNELFRLANKYGDWISVHTDVKWNGSFSQLEKACQESSKPVLAKGIHREDYDVRRAIACGADAVLVVGRIPEEELLAHCFIEPRTLSQLKEMSQTLAAEQRIVWNSRNLLTGRLKNETFEEARTIWPGWLCQASNISTPADVDPMADAILVGQNLPSFINSLSC